MSCFMPIISIHVQSYITSEHVKCDIRDMNFTARVIAYVHLADCRRWSVIYDYYKINIAGRVKVDTEYIVQAILTGSILFSSGL